MEKKKEKKTLGEPRLSQGPVLRTASLMLLNPSQIVVFFLNDKCVFITTDSHHRLSQFSYFCPVGVLEQIDRCFESAHRASVHIFRWNQSA